ncbi:MAG: DUF2157 domain-containing protein [Holophagales bacterium]|nr:DUF2157 domain-containing protein [Holophagales bacterium]
MASFERRLLRELEVWAAEGLIDARQAEAIRDRYAVPSDSGWSRLVLSAVGAVVFGLGVILFFAYNWADMPKAAKLAVLFAGLATAHGAALALTLRGRGTRALIESLHLLGTMLFGAGIWLVSQIYHFDNPYPDAFLVWALGALALAWVLPSIPQALLGLVLIVVWSVQGLYGRMVDPQELPALLVAVGIVPLAAWQRSKTLLFFTAAALLFLLPIALADRLENLTVFVVFAMATAYVGLGAWARATGRAWIRPVGLAGHLAYLPLLYTLSFEAPLRELHGTAPENAFEGLAFGFSLAVAAGLLGLAVVAAGRRAERFQGRAEGAGERLWNALALGALAWLTLLVLAVPDADIGWLALPFSLILLGHGVLAILDGSARQSWRRVVFGCLVVSVVTMVRFADLFDSLLARSAAFLLLGAGLFAVGHFYQRQGRRLQARRLRDRAPDDGEAEETQEADDA